MQHNPLLIIIQSPGLTVRYDAPTMLPNELFIWHSYLPASLAIVLTMINNWSSAVKKWRSVVCRAQPSFLHDNFGRGEPLAMHSSTIESPTIISLFSIGFTKDGVSKNQEYMLIECILYFYILYISNSQTRNEYLPNIVRLAFATIRPAIFCAVQE